MQEWQKYPSVTLVASLSEFVLAVGVSGSATPSGEERRVTKFALVVLWLATPLVVWAGAFVMGWLGAWLGGTLSWLVIGGLAGGLVSVVGWSSLILYLRNRQVRLDSGDLDNEQ